MIKLKQILLEGKPSTIFIPRRIEDRIERLIGLYIRDGSKGNLRLAGLGLSELPEILKNVSVGKDFYCNGNNLTSLEDAPKFVGQNFICSYNLLISLEGAPEYVDGDFYCSKNPVKFTEKQVRDVCNVGGKIIV